MQVRELIDDISALSARVRQFERSYGLDSEVFAELMRQGRLDDGAHLEDFTEWAGLHEILRDRQAELHRRAEERVRELPVGEGGLLHLEPTGA